MDPEDLEDSTKLLDDLRTAVTAIATMGAAVEAKVGLKTTLAAVAIVLTEVSYLSGIPHEDLMELMAAAHKDTLKRDPNSTDNITWVAPAKGVH